MSEERLVVFLLLALAALFFVDLVRRGQIRKQRILRYLATKTIGYWVTMAEIQRACGIAWWQVYSDLHTLQKSKHVEEYFHNGSWCYRLRAGGPHDIGNR